MVIKKDKIIIKRIVSAQFLNEDDGVGVVVEAVIGVIRGDEGGDDWIFGDIYGKGAIDNWSSCAALLLPVGVVGALALFK
jgi:hypothetical protein